MVFSVLLLVLRVLCFGRLIYEITKLEWVAGEDGLEFGDGGLGFYECLGGCGL